MLTSRGGWPLTAAIVCFFLAVLFEQEDLVVFALTPALWLAAEWTVFSLRTEGARRLLRVERRLNGLPVDRATLWAGQPVLVEVEIHCSAAASFPWLRFIDRTPDVDLLDGSTTLEGRLSNNEPLKWSYRIQTKRAGRIRFEGLRVEAADLQGLFFDWWFLRAPVEVTVLPPMIDVGKPVAVAKRMNFLPAQGVHRHRRPGSGGELLDLREYQPGDPPKSIAWKVSARRDCLMTREYESEVPIRCTLMVDASDGMRLGPPGRTGLDRAAAIAASLARHLADQHDPVGLCLFDERGVEILPPESGPRQLVRLGAALAAAVARPPRPTYCPADDLVAPALNFTREVYPELVTPEVNQPGTWYQRLPRFSLPAPIYLFCIALALGGGAMFYFVGSIEALEDIPGLGVIYLAALVAGVTAVFVGLQRLVRRLGRLWRTRRRRKQLAGVLALDPRYGGPGSMPVLLYDDDRFSAAVQEFLSRHQAPFPRPLHAPNGEYLFAHPEKLEVAGRALLRAVAHGKDNEMFVVVADLLELPDHWEPLLKAIKVALARRHKVVVVAPWPGGMPTPVSDDWPDTTLAASDPMQRRFTNPAIAVWQLDMVRHRRAYEDLSARLNKLGAVLILAAAGDAVPEIVRRLNRLRAAAHR
ncbi:MAG: DUF58 domain-containing protein [Planctomycetia bacterium]